jgi:hypothetical protein
MNRVNSYANKLLPTMLNLLITIAMSSRSTIIERPCLYILAQLSSALSSFRTRTLITSFKTSMSNPTRQNGKGRNEVAMLRSMRWQRGHYDGWNTTPGYEVKKILACCLGTVLNGV